MKILVTGGTGMIGRAFICRYPDHQYTVVSRSIAKAKKLLPASVEVISSLALLDALDDFDAVMNLAGEPIIDKRWTDKQKGVIRESRWQITQHLVELFQRSSTPPRVLISGSAIGIYGDRGDECLPESTTLFNTDFASDLCARWESAARQAEPFTRVVLLRTGIVLSAQDGALKKMLPPFRLGLGGPMGSGKQYMAWIHMDDHLRAMAYLLEERHISGPINLVAPGAETNWAFTKTLASVLKRFAFIPIPAILLKVILGESASLLLGSQRVLPERLLGYGFTFRFPELRLALSDLLES